MNISEAKAQLSRLINLVHHGETVVIAKNNLPIADIVPHVPEQPRTLGLLAGKLHIPDDIVGPDPEVEKLFYGDDA
ncbi:MAG: type II toxin-antitoxin system Phd/YefM family antitoxin [Spirochaetota bacterium]